MTTEEFEARRLALLAAHGRPGRSLRLPDGAGRTTYAFDIGEPEGEVPTVLVHGGMGHAGDWCLVAGKLSGRVVVPDRPGCGLSSPMDYTGVDYRADAARWLESVVDGLGTKQIDLVGNSMGGYFSIAFALAFPQRVRRLVLLGAPAGLDRFVPRFLRILSIRGLGAFLWEKMGTDDPEVLRRRVFPGLVAHPERLSTEYLTLGLTNQAFPSSRQCVTTLVPEVLDLGGFQRKLLYREELARLAVPTLFAWGDADSYAPPESGKEVAARMPDARVEVLPDVGHMPHLDAPELVARTIDAFLHPALASSRVA
jgi:pimeloyl-ACP methyl ester carboxylesterase